MIYLNLENFSAPATDYALFAGFSPEIKIGLPMNRANGDNCCDFHIMSEKFSITSALKVGIKKRS